MKVHDTRCTSQRWVPGEHDKQCTKKVVAWHKEYNSAQYKMPTPKELCSRLSAGHMVNNSAQETYSQGAESTLSTEHKELDSAWCKVLAHKNLSARLSAIHKKHGSAE